MRFVLFALLFLTAPVFAYDPGAELPDSKQEARARDLFRELRCMVCQNQSIDDSNAPLAKDLRALVRERVAAGDNDEAIKAFLVERYGKFVLLKPLLDTGTLVLWGAPAFVLLLGGVTALVAFRRPARQDVARALTPAEKDKLQAALQDRG
jgi:cytochrome c-type biogenesis protein CcmH